MDASRNVIKVDAMGRLGGGANVQDVPSPAQVGTGAEGMASPVRPGSAAGSPVTADAAARVLADAVKRILFENRSAEVYAAIDGANCPDLLDKLYELRPEFECLYAGELRPDMAEVAPYLVSLEPDSPFTEWLLRYGWGKSWAVFAAASGADLRSMRRHFRSILTVYEPDGSLLYFRWYDPRVMRIYLPTCTEAEATQVLGPSRCLIMEDEEKAVLLRFRVGKGGPTSEAIVLTGATDR